MLLIVACTAGTTEDGQQQPEEVKEFEYEVEWLAGGFGAGATSVLRAPQMERQWTAPSLKLVKRWLRDSAYCEEVQVCSWTRKDF